MKKYIFIIIVLLLSFFKSNSQDTQPEALYFQLYNSGTPQVKQMNINDFPQNNFLLGWQWYGHPRMTEAMKMNACEGWQGTWEAPDYNNSNIPINYIWDMRAWDKHFQYDVPHLASVIFIYKPTLNYDNNLNLLNYDDPEHNIFGFRVSNNQKVINQNRLELNKKLTYINPILQKPWINDRYKSSN